MRDNMKGGALTEVTFYILLSLYAPKHGYAVMQFIEEKTGGRLSLGAGTLYGALNSLQEKKWIKPCGDCEGRKKEYIITSLGKEVAKKELVRLNELVEVAVINHSIVFGVLALISLIPVLVYQIQIMHNRQEAKTQE